MKAIPVIRAATVTDVFHPDATDPLSKKKNAVAANIPIEITQKDIPTKSSVANKAVFALATLSKLIKAKKVSANNFSLFIIKNSRVFSLIKQHLCFAQMKFSEKILQKLTKLKAFFH